MITNVLFDLDGTLTDPALGITNSVMHALATFGIEVSDRTSLYKFIGPPLLESFHNYYGFDEAQSRLAMKRYREYFAPKGIFENKVYDGVVAMLQQLCANGKRCYLATSKPEVYAKQIIEHFALAPYFTFCGGSDFEETRVKKAAVISYVLESCGLSDKIETCIMVGDREHDVIGANANGIPCIGVLYGYGAETELTKAGALYLAKTPAAVAKIILG